MFEVGPRSSWHPSNFITFIRRWQLVPLYLTYRNCLRECGLNSVGQRRRDGPFSTTRPVFLTFIFLVVFFPFRPIFLSCAVIRIIKRKNVYVISHSKKEPKLRILFDWTDCVHVRYWRLMCACMTRWLVAILLADVRMLRVGVYSSLCNSYWIIYFVRGCLCQAMLTVRTEYTYTHGKKLHVLGWLSESKYY